MIFSKMRDLETERRKVTELVNGYEKDQAELKRLRAEVERLQDQTNERGRLAIDNGIRMERAEAEVERLKAREPLTDEQIKAIAFNTRYHGIIDTCRAIEAAHGIGMEQKDD